MASSSSLLVTPSVDCSIDRDLFMNAERGDGAVWIAGDKDIVGIRRTVRQYAVAVAATAFAGLANAALWPELGARYPLIAFFPAIALCSWFGGLGPGVLSTGLSVIAASYLWFSPRFFARPSHQGDALVLIMFAGIGLTIAWLYDTLRRRTDRAEHAEREAVRLSRAVRASDSRLLESERFAREQAERANRLKDELLSTVSHELRTPLGAILGWTDLLKKGLVDDASRDRALEAIHRNAQQQAHLIGELLDAARINSGKRPLIYESVDLQGVVRGAWEVVAPAAEAKSLTGHIDIDPAANSFFGDAARLQQIVSNLFSNAVKFTPNGGRVNARVRRYDGVVEIIVSDNGRGIAREFLPLVFEPFRQADESKAGREAGFGLGLSIVKQLVEAHGGDVQVASDGEGRGSTFTVRLPWRAHAVGRAMPSRAS
jgi:signal transduction histidine kinase